MTLPKWTEDRTAKLQAIVGGESPVSVATLETAADKLETSVRSVASKLRKLGHEVASTAKDSVPTFNEKEAAVLSDFVTQNSGVYTYAEIAAAVLGAKFSSKEVQGKLLSMELTKHVKPTPKVEVAKAYSEAEEKDFIKLASTGAFLEEIAAKLNKSLNSVRGKALSLSRSVEGFVIPKQRESHAKNSTDALTDLGDISGLTVAQIADKIGKTERGVKTMLTQRYHRHKGVL